MWAKQIWRDFIPPKFSFTTWQAIRGRLPTKDRLAFLNTDPTCPLCSTHPESSPHLFFQCEVTKKVWEKNQGLARNQPSPLIYT